MALKIYLTQTKIKDIFFQLYLVDSFSYLSKSQLISEHMINKE